MSAPTGWLVVDASYPPPAIAFSFTSPRVEINGHPVTIPWGQSRFDLPAGNHLVRVSASSRSEYGPAQLSVAVAPGQVTTVYYRPPAFRAMYGAIGFTPQQSPGMPAAVLLWIVILGLVLAMVVILSNV